MSVRVYPRDPRSAGAAQLAESPEQGDIASSPTATGFLCLENGAIRAYWDSNGDGSLLEIFDRRTGAMLGPVEGAQGLLGVFCEIEGAESLSWEARFAMIEGEDEASLLCGSPVAHLTAGWQATWKLSLDSAAIALTLVFRNRTLTPLACRLGLSAPTRSFPEWGQNDQLIWLRGAGGFGLALKTTGSWTLQVHNEHLALVFDIASGTMGPRASVSEQIALIPFQGFADPVAMSDSLLLSQSAGSWVLSATRTFLRAKIVVLAAGRPYESQVDLYPEASFEIDLAEFPAPPTALKVLAEDRSELLSWSTGLARPNVEWVQPKWPNPSLVEGWVSQGLPASLKHEPQWRAFSFGLDALAAFKSRDWAQAEMAANRQISVNADDPIAWWEKAAATRHLGLEADDQSLPNAHYLSPFEPLLRAEALFNQPVAEGHEANPLLATLAGFPQESISVAIMLLERGLTQDGARWIDECLRVEDSAILRYLLADSLVSETRLHAQAAEEVRLAGNAPIFGPFYHRFLWEAIGRLVTKFPGDAGLARPEIQSMKQYFSGVKHG